MARDRTSNDPLISAEWFPPIRGGANVGRARGLVVRAFVSLLVAAALVSLGHRTIAAVALTVGVALTLTSALSGRAHEVISRALSAFASGVGRVATIVVLSPLAIVGMPLARYWMRLRGITPLGADDPDAPSFWTGSASDARRTRYAHSMFAPERRTYGRRSGLQFLVGVLILVGAAEVLLQAVGFGDPIVYIPDARFGFYPAPNQVKMRWGARVATNHFGMRAPNYGARKPDGAFRILMIGDSTLWGGSNIDQAELYARRVEDRLSELHPGRSVQVLNIGVNAWGPLHELGYIRAFGTFDADLVIVCMPSGDVYRHLYGLEYGRFYAAGSEPRFAIEEILSHYMWQYRRRTLGTQAAVSREWQAQKGLSAYLELADELHDAGAEVMVEVLPSLPAGVHGEPREGESPMVGRLTEAFDSRDIRVGFPNGLFRGEGEVDDLYHDVVHLNPLGHAVYARYLEGRIDELSATYDQWSAEGAR